VASSTHVQPSCTCKSRRNRANRALLSQRCFQSPSPNPQVQALVEVQTRSDPIQSKPKPRSLMASSPRVYKSTSLRPWFPRPRHSAPNKELLAHCVRPSQIHRRYIPISARNPDSIPPFPSTSSLIILKQLLRPIPLPNTPHPAQPLQPLPLQFIPQPPHPRSRALLTPHRTMLQIQLLQHAP